MHVVAAAVVDDVRARCGYRGPLPLTNQEAAFGHVASFWAIAMAYLIGLIANTLPILWMNPVKPKFSIGIIFIRLNAKNPTCFRGTCEGIR